MVQFRKNQRSDVSQTCRATCTGTWYAAAVTQQFQHRCHPGETSFSRSAFVRVEGTPVPRVTGRIDGARRECRGTFRAYVDLERACRSRR